MLAKLCATCLVLLAASPFTAPFSTCDVSIILRGPATACVTPAVLSFNRRTQMTRTLHSNLVVGPGTKITTDMSVSPVPSRQRFGDWARDVAVTLGSPLQVEPDAHSPVPHPDDAPPVSDQSDHAFFSILRV